METAVAGTGRGGFGRRLARAWLDIAGSFRAELAAEPGEARLFFYAVLSGLVWFALRFALLLTGDAGAASGADVVAGRVGAEFIGAVFFRTLALYAVAAVAGLLARRLGGVGNWRATRAAVFWAALVAAPPVFLATLALLAAGASPVVAGTVADAAGGLLLAWAMSQTLAVAHGFRSPLAVLAAMVAIAAGCLALVYGAGTML